MENYSYLDNLGTPRGPAFFPAKTWPRRRRASAWLVYFSHKPRKMGRCRTSRWCRCEIFRTGKLVMYCHKRPPRMKGWGVYAHEVYVDGSRWLRPRERAHVVTTATPVLNVDIRTTVNSLAELSTPDSITSTSELTSQELPSSAPTSHVPASVPAPASVLGKVSPPDIAQPEGGLSGTSFTSTSNTRVTVSLANATEQSGDEVSSHTSGTVVSADVSTNVSTVGDVSTLVSTRATSGVSNAITMHVSSPVSTGSEVSTHVSSDFSSATKQVSTQVTNDSNGVSSSVESRQESSPVSTQQSESSVSDTAFPFTSADLSQSVEFHSDTSPYTPLKSTETSSNSLLPSELSKLPSPTAPTLPSSTKSSQNLVPSTSVTTHVSITFPTLLPPTTSESPNYLYGLDEIPTSYKDNNDEEDDDFYHDDILEASSESFSASSVQDFTSYLDELAEDSVPLLTSQEMKATTSSSSLQPPFIWNLISTTQPTSSTPALSECSNI